MLAQVSKQGKISSRTNSYTAQYGRFAYFYTDKQIIITAIFTVAYRGCQWLLLPARL